MVHYAHLGMELANARKAGMVLTAHSELVQNGLLEQIAQEAAVVT